MRRKHTMAAYFLLRLRWVLSAALFVIISCLLAIYTAAGSGASAAVPPDADNTAQMAGTAEPGMLTINQVSANKPEVTVYFDLTGEFREDGLTGEPPAGELSAEARLGGETLTPVSLESFDAGSEGIWYIFAVDCSTSMTAQQISSIRGAITDVAESMGGGDRATVIAFGKTVDVLVNLSGDKDEIIEAASALRANQNGTLFYDALIKVLELGGTYGDGIPERRSAFVFSDAEDYNVGGYVKEEVDAGLTNAPIAIHAIGLNNNSRAALDAFGAMARLSGGSIDVVTHNTLRGTVKTRADGLRSGYVARFAAKTNIISGVEEELAFTVAYGGSSYSAEARLTPARWIPDNAPPRIISAEQTAPSTILVRFDKPMLGADAAGNFRVEDAGGDLLAIRTVSYDETAYTATLTLVEIPLSGKITVTSQGVTDASMERNAVAGPVTIDFKGAEPTAPPETPSAPLMPPDPAAPPVQEAGGEPLSPAVWLFGSLAIALIVMGVTLGVIKSRGGLVRVDGKLRFAGAARQEVFVTEEEADSVQYQFITTKPPELSLRVIDGAGKAKDLTLPVSGSMFIGRGAGNDLVFDDPRMSRHHFVIEAVDGGGFTVQNLSESGATFLNGVPLGSPRPLLEGDKIAAGDITFVVLGA